MPFYIVREDLTKMRCDAIVTPADSSLSGGGGLDAAIHKAAGAELDAACRAAGRDNKRGRNPWVPASII